MLHRPRDFVTVAVTASLLALHSALVAAEGSPHWSYTGPTDPAKWGTLDKESTPPCSEGVTWFVLKNPTSISADEIARFARSYPMNARPVQPLNGREVRASR